MKIAVPRETLDREYRVGLTPDAVRQLATQGHPVLVERGAGEGSGFSDEDYARAGATLVGVEEAWGEGELVVKVKEPSPAEAARLRPGQTLFAYLHLAPNRPLTEALLASGVQAIAYETIQDRDGRFPLLAPMSAIAGRLAIQIGVTLLQKDRGGKGVLLGGVPGVPRGRVTVVGGGIVGSSAVRVACALGAEVTVLDADLRRLAELEDRFRGALTTLASSRANLERAVAEADLLVGAAYLRGRRTPRLVSAEMVASMQPGSAVIDVAVDQGGCIDTIRPTTHSQPTYVAHGVIHYGVANMPAVVPRTATLALVDATLPYLERLAGQGVEAALRADPALALGASVWRGELVEEGVAEAHGLPWRPLASLLGG